MSYDIPEPVPIPSDVERPDKVLAGLTARQVAIAAVAAVIIWAGFQATRHVMPLPAFAALASPVGLLATALVIGERDGLSLDRLLLAAWRQRRAPRRLVTAPEGVPAPPAWASVPGPPAPPPAVLAPLWQQIGPDGVIGLGSAGAAAVAAVSTVNFALRSPEEQDALAAAYGRWLNSLTGPVQILVRAGRADLSGAVAALREAAPGLPHPALEQAALEHASFLEGLAADRDVLTRQALLIVREPGHGAGRPAAPPPGARCSGPGRPPGCWAARTCRSRCSTAGRSPRCSPPAPTPPPRPGRPGRRPCRAARSPARAGRREPPPDGPRRRDGPAGSAGHARPAVGRGRRPARPHRGRLVGHPGRHRLPGRGQRRLAGAAAVLPGPRRRHLARRADPGRGRRRPAAPPARPPGIGPPGRHRPGAAGRPGHRGRRRRRPRPGLPARPGRGQAVPARPVPDRPRRLRGGPGRRGPGGPGAGRQPAAGHRPGHLPQPAGVGHDAAGRDRPAAAAPHHGHRRARRQLPVHQPRPAPRPRRPAGAARHPVRPQHRRPRAGGLGPLGAAEPQLRHPRRLRRRQVLPGQAGDPPVPVRGHRVLGDRPRGRVRPPRPGRRRRVRPPRRAGRAPEPVRPARRRARPARHPDPPRPVHPHRHRGAAAAASRRRPSGPRWTRRS